MDSVKKYKFIEKWHKPPTHFYEDNYKFGINFYQPMIDYLNVKKVNKRREIDYPHLPWNNERGLEKYSKKNVGSYSHQDLHKLVLETEEQAKYNLENVTIRKHRSNFGLNKSVSAASLSKHIASLEMDTLEKEKLLGKSTRSIQDQLLTESVRNLCDLSTNDWESESRYQRARSCGHEANSRVMHEGRAKIDDCAVINTPLNLLKHELREFDKKSAHFCQQKRWIILINSYINLYY